MEAWVRAWFALAAAAGSGPHPARTTAFMCKNKRPAVLDDEDLHSSGGED